MYFAAFPILSKVQKIVAFFVIFVFIERMANVLFELWNKNNG